MASHQVAPPPRLMAPPWAETTSLPFSGSLKMLLGCLEVLSPSRAPRMWYILKYSNIIDFSNFHRARSRNNRGYLRWVERQHQVGCALCLVPHMAARCGSSWSTAQGGPIVTPLSSVHVRQVRSADLRVAESRHSRARSTRQPHGAKLGVYNFTSHFHHSPRKRRSWC